MPHKTCLHGKAGLPLWADGALTSPVVRRWDGHSRAGGSSCAFSKESLGTKRERTAEQLSTQMNTSSPCIRLI